MRTKILSSLIVIGIIATFAAGTSLAALNDVESSVGNVLQAGELDIKVGWDGDSVDSQPPMNNPGTMFDIEDIQPGESGSAAIEIENVANPAYLELYADQTDSSENGYVDETEKKGEKKIKYSEPEDSTPNKGELGDSLRFELWYDDGDGVREPDDEEIFEGTAHELGESMDNGYLLDANYEDGAGYGDTERAQPFDKGSTHIGFKWKLPEGADCDIQTDSKTFDFMFNGQQSRHNDERTLGPFQYFNDRETSEDNYFQAGVFDKCATVKEKKEKKVCKPVKRPGPGKEHVERDAKKKGDHEVKYRVKKSGNSVKFTDAEDDLGSSTKYEADTFEMTVKGENHETVYVELKTHHGTEEFELEGEGDRETTGEKDLWGAEIVEVDSKGGKTDYKIKISADNKKDKLSAMKYVKFKFCKTVEYYDDGKKGDHDDSDDDKSQPDDGKDDDHDHDHDNDHDDSKDDHDHDKDHKDEEIDMDELGDRFDNMDWDKIIDGAELKDGWKDKLKDEKLFDYVDVTQRENGVKISLKDKQEIKQEQGIEELTVDQEQKIEQRNEVKIEGQESEEKQKESDAEKESSSDQKDEETEQENEDSEDKEDEADNEKESESQEDEEDSEKDKDDSESESKQEGQDSKEETNDDEQDGEKKEEAESEDENDKDKEQDKEQEEKDEEDHEKDNQDDLKDVDDLEELEDKLKDSDEIEEEVKDRLEDMEDDLEEYDSENHDSEDEGGKKK